MASSCTHCGLKFSDPSLTLPSCPNCGQNLESASARPGGDSSTVPARKLDPIRGYFKQVWSILTRPSAFFRSMPVSGGVSGPLAFALITHWLGAAAGFTWRALIGGAIGGYVDRMVHMVGDVAEVDNPGRNTQLLELSDRLKHWFWGAGSIIADPFVTLLQIFFISFLVFLGARIFVTPGKNGAPREITFESALRIVCFAMTTSILAVLPLFGGFVGYLYEAIIAIIGAREVYRIDGGRATLVALFPQVLLMGFVLMIMIAGMVAFFKFFAMTLS